MGGATDWPFPVIKAHAVVTSLPREYDPDSLETLVTVANELIDRGACIITTDLGFSSMQRDLTARLSVPVACSALIQLPTLRVALGDVGVITMDRQLLSQWNLVAVSASPETPVIGLPGTSPWRRSNSDSDSDDDDTKLKDLFTAASELLKRHSVRAIVLEDPAFVDYTRRLQSRIGSLHPGVTIYDLPAVVKWLYHGHLTHYVAPRPVRVEDASIIMTTESTLL